MGVFVCLGVDLCVSRVILFVSCVSGVIWYV